ncbi:Hypothetical predicted protein [Octopus vulgaris]|uniref:Sine oculis-binding protein homolog n=1 Tax=Octopus vulgaris TaxID=6645 RepID=A0AA36BGQ3_OCTVU|nr:Hypothetical predicted protein [Octopus vulgaris]
MKAGVGGRGGIKGVRGEVRECCLDSMDDEDATSCSVSQPMVSLIPPFTIKVKSEPLDDIKNEADMDDHEDRMSTELLEPPYHRPSSTSTQLSQIRDSPHSDERNTTITDYAETTMNELLGMYGYDKVSHQETQNLNLERYTASSTPDTSIQGMDDCHGDSDDESSDAPSIGAERKTYNKENLPSGYIICAWCQKPGLKLFTLKTLNGSKVFCSEVCFTQCRRASFKKNKICDWCKHVRHTVNYVDFQDGEQQLQFCSEKCLNQYKMNIFCQETQEHLQQIQSSLDTNSSSNGVPDDKQILITPDLWLQEDIARRSKKLRVSDEARNINKAKDSTEKHKNLSSHIDNPESSASSNSHDKHADKFNVDKSLKERLVKRIHKDPPSHTTSPAVTPLPKRPPQPPAQLIPPMFPTPAAMNNWWHQAQMMASLGPSYPAFGGFPPMVYPGVFNPPYTPIMPGTAAPPIPETSRPHSRHVSNASSTPGPSLTPNASASPDISQTHSQSPNVVPNTSNKASTIPRTHHFLPPMWPPGYPMMPFPPPQMTQSGDTSTAPGPHPTMPTFPMPAPNWTSLGIPPQTVIIPFPFLIPLPFPVPIPIPVPMKAEQIEKLLKQTSSTSTTTTTTNNNNNNSSSSSQKEEETSSECEDVKPRNLTEHLSLNQNYNMNGNRSSSSSISSSNSMEMTVQMRNRMATTVGKNVPKECVTCASFQTPSKSNLLPRPSSVLSIKSDSHLLQSEMINVKRPPTPASVGSLDSPKKVRHELMTNSDYSINDEVIDLSKDSGRESISRDIHSPHIQTLKKQKATSSSVRSLSVPPLSVSETSDSHLALHVPKIHIVSTPKDPPLSQQLPLPPTDHAYSLRRGLILDAPSVPKRPKSPSPERRNYIRSMPRDIMEARRCLRTRIKTK